MGSFKTALDPDPTVTFCNHSPKPNPATWGNSDSTFKRLFVSISHDLPLLSASSGGRFRPVSDLIVSDRQ